jgi:dolichol-phosphate mannosyltransferase
MISLILPTYNEAANIKSLIDMIDGVLATTPHEIIVVDDDSPDGTWQVAEGIRSKHPTLRVLRRIGRRGLSSAVVEGFDMAHGDVLAVMDADGQHDSSLLLKLLVAIDAGADIAIGSRYVKGGSVGDWVKDRRIISSIGTFFAKSLSRVHVSDPLGGFFAMKASLYEKVRHKLKPSGFKILLEILANVPSIAFVSEVPLIFRMRQHGHSKLSFKVQLQFMQQVLRLSVRKALRAINMTCSITFLILVLLGIVGFGARLWSMHPLYTDKALRTSVEQSVRLNALREGWLLSDITFTHVDRATLGIAHRDHIRTGSPVTYCTINLATTSLTCDE